MRGAEVIEEHATHIQTIGQLRGDRVAPLDCCYKNEFYDYLSTDYMVVSLEMDPKNLALLCEELVDGCRIVKNTATCSNIELQNLCAFGTLRSVSAGLQTI